MKKLNVTLSVILLILILGALAVSATGSIYTTDSDPLVALSYVEQTENRIVEKLLNAVTNDSLAELSSSLSYVVVHIQNGQSINATGSCEIILRSGNAVAFISNADNINSGVGLNDMTGGYEITNGQEIPKYHNILIPRADGRGITVTSGEAYLMVRGPYEVF